MDVLTKQSLPVAAIQTCNFDSFKDEIRPVHQPAFPLYSNTLHFAQIFRHEILDLSAREVHSSNYPEFNVTPVDHVVPYVYIDSGGTQKTRYHRDGAIHIVALEVDGFDRSARSKV